MGFGGFEPAMRALEKMVKWENVVWKDSKKNPHTEDMEKLWRAHKSRIEDLRGMTFDTKWESVVVFDHVHLWMPNFARAYFQESLKIAATRYPHRDSCREGRRCVYREDHDAAWFLRQGLHGWHFVAQLAVHRPDIYERIMRRARQDVGIAGAVPIPGPEPTQAKSKYPPGVKA